MEKRRPHCPLREIQRLIDAGQVRATLSALAGGAALGLDFDGILGVVSALTTADFYKSMTTQADYRVWQDVYLPATPVGEVYLKLTVIDDLLVVTFKEL